MEENKVEILFLTDLHISGNKNSMLENEEYIEEFLASLMVDTDEYRKFDALIIGGDIADKGAAILLIK